MRSENGHPGDEQMQDALDRRLPADRMAPIEEHLQGCEECRRTWEALAWAKEQASHAPPLTPPAYLAAGIARALDEEGRKLGWAPRPPGHSWMRRAAAAVGAAAAALLVAFIVARPSDPASAVARDHAAFRSGRLRLSLETGDVRRMEAHLTSAGLGFPARVFDLGMMKYELVGGAVHAVAGHPSALFVYRGPDGHILMCQMYRGSLAELPTGGDRHEHDGIPFLVHRKSGLTLVFWPEGDVICVLAADGGPEVVLPLAFAKARAAAAASAD